MRVTPLYLCGPSVLYVGVRIETGDEPLNQARAFGSGQLQCFGFNRFDC